MKIPYDIERKIRRFCVSNLMLYLVVGMAAVFVMDLFMLQVDLVAMMELTRAQVMRGQVWRLITFVLVPPGGINLLFIVLSLYFYWLVGTMLENRWGTVKFNLYYALGILGNIASCFITGYATNHVLNMSLFFAFAILYPDMEFRVFFILPIKAKYLALLDALYFVYLCVFGGWPMIVMVAFSLINLFLFLGGDFINWIRRDSQYWKTRYRFRKQTRGR